MYNIYYQNNTEFSFTKIGVVAMLYAYFFVCCRQATQEL